MLSPTYSSTAHACKEGEQLFAALQRVEHISCCGDGQFQQSVSPHSVLNRNVRYAGASVQTQQDLANLEAGPPVAIYLVLTAKFFPPCRQPRWGDSLLNKRDKGKTNGGSNTLG